MTEPNIRYDPPSDSVHVLFVPGASGTGIELNEHLLLRVDRGSGQPIGLVIFNYSVLAQRTELGVPSYPLSGLALLPADLRDRILDLLQAEPLNRFLRLSAFILPNHEPTPITSVQPEAITFAA